MKLVILIPTHDQRVDMRMANSLVELYPYLAGPPICSSASDIRTLRDSMLAMGLAAVEQSKATHLVWADSDMVWMPSQLMTLATYVAAHPRHACAALATTRTPHREIVQTLRADSAPVGRYLECVNIGFGLVVMHAKTIGLMASGLATYQHGSRTLSAAHTGSEPGVAEDRVFWQRWIGAGNKAMVDTDTRILHVGPFVYGVDPNEPSDAISRRMRRAEVDL